MATKKKKMTAANVHQAVINWLAENHHYEVDVDYDRSPCTGECDDYCRCTTIGGERVKNADPQKLAYYAVPEKFHNTVFHYCIERLFVAAELWDENHWEVGVCSGYYGQEISGVTMAQSTQADLKKKIQELMKNKTDLEKILFVLVEEYGYLIDPLTKVMTADIRTVNLSDIKLGNVEYHAKLKKGKCPYYSNDDYHEYTLPVAVCLPEGERFRLIDGYHRYGTAKQEGRKEVEIVLLAGFKKEKV